MDVSKRFCNEEHKFLFEIKEGCKVPCVKIFCSLICWEVSIYLKYYKYHAFLKIVKKSGKKWMFRKTFAMESANFFFEMKERKYKVSCVKILWLH